MASHKVCSIRSIDILMLLLGNLFRGRSFKIYEENLNVKSFSRKIRVVKMMEERDAVVGNLYA